MSCRLGIPFVTLYILLKNNDDIRSGGPARQRYEFLVADYRNEFHYWDTLGAIILSLNVQPTASRSC